MSLKTKDGILDSRPAHYVRDTHPAGINFELKDGTALFGPYSFLSHAVRNTGEIIIHYSFGGVRVKGDCLGLIYSLIRTHELSSISCATDRAAKTDEPQISEIIFEAIDFLTS